MKEINNGLTYYFKCLRGFIYRFDHRSGSRYVELGGLPKRSHLSDRGTSSDYFDRRGHL
uniref:Uncharacterized protein n=1 Tax=Picea glauca TaxID=3330 RepID=A0A101LXP8_PICGL|nr:hypothetical protein ABT39_MTgene5466 [Picea glauca]